MAEITKLNLYNTFYNDYVNGNKITLRFLKDFKSADRDELSGIIKPLNKTYADAQDILLHDNRDIDSEQGKIYLNWLKGENVRFIVTGQQLGLLGSPLYTIYKILTTIKLAEQLNKSGSQFRYIPLFWLESEDHDFEEVNHFGIWEKSFEPHTIRYAGQNRERVSIRHYHFDENIKSVITQLKELLMPTEFSDHLFNNLHSWFAQGQNWLGATRSLLKHIFYQSGLLFFKPGFPDMKKAAIPFFKKLLKNAEQNEYHFEKQSQQLQKLGYDNQIHVIPGKAMLFFEDENKNRIHVRFKKDKFILVPEDKEYTLSECFDFIEEHPEKVSTNVISRTLLQSYLFPVSTYVAGPGEIAYWAQLGGVFDNMKLNMPVVYPRVSATILEPKIARYIDKNNIDLNTIQLREAKFIADYFKMQHYGEDDIFSESRSEVEQIFNNLKPKIEAIDPTLENIRRKTMERVSQQIDILENKTLNARKQKNHHTTNQLKQVHKSFFPAGLPQERFASIVYFLNKFGPNFINKIKKQISTDIFSHQLIRI